MYFDVAIFLTPRPSPRRALAMVLTLLLAGTLNELASISGSGSPTPVQSTTGAKMEPERVHEPVGLPCPGPVDGGLVAGSCDADRDRW